MTRFCPQCGTPVEERPFEGKLRPTPGGYVDYAEDPAKN